MFCSCRESHTLGHTDSHHEELLQPGVQLHQHNHQLPVDYPTQITQFPTKLTPCRTAVCTAAQPATAATWLHQPSSQLAALSRARLHSYNYDFTATPHAQLGLQTRKTAGLGLKANSDITYLWFMDLAVFLNKLIVAKNSNAV